MKILDFMRKPADTVFLLRLSVCGIISAVNVAIARFVTGILLNAGLTTQHDSFFYLRYPVLMPLPISFVLIAIGTILVFLPLFFWGQSNPASKVKVEVTAIVIMVLSFTVMINDIMILIHLLGLKGLVG
jgi:hypothetical protein